MLLLSGTVIEVNSFQLLSMVSDESEGFELLVVKEIDRHTSFGKVIDNHGGLSW